MNWFKIHEDYDKIPEPYRMWIALYFMSPMFIGLALMETHREWTLGIIFVCLIGIHRILYHMMRGD